jgi:hypothetical protein
METVLISGKGHPVGLTIWTNERVSASHNNCFGRLSLGIGDFFQFADLCTNLTVAQFVTVGIEIDLVNFEYKGKSEKFKLNTKLLHKF